MIDCQALSKIAQTNPPADMAAIEAAQQALGLQFPKSYIELMLCTNGLYAETFQTVQYYPSMEIKEQLAESVTFHEVEYLEEQNIPFEIQIYTPNCICIGDDGSDHFILLDCSTEDSPIYYVPMGSLDLEGSKILASNLEDWINKKFRIYTGIEISYPEKCDVYMVKAPEEGAKELLNIKKFFRLETSIGDLYRGMQNLPYLIANNVWFVRYASDCAQYNKTDEYFMVCEPGDFSKPIVIPPEFYK